MSPSHKHTGCIDEPYILNMQTSKHGTHSVKTHNRTTHNKLNTWATGTPPKTWGDRSCSRRV